MTPRSDELEHIASAERRADLRATLSDLPGIDLSLRQQCDLELLGNGGFAPLTGFMDQADYDAVCASMRLADGTLWPMPITLDVSDTLAKGLSPGDQVALRDLEGVPKAIVNVADVWQPDHASEAKQVLGTNDPVHPGVQYLHHHTHSHYVGGPVEWLEPPDNHDFTDLRHTPAQVRAHIQAAGWERVVAFQTRNPLHRAHFEMTRRAMEEHDAAFLLHPVVGMTKPGDVDHYTRVRCYRAIMEEYPAERSMLSLLPLAMRMAGPREALWHALIRRTHGATHFIVGRDHAGPGVDGHGQPFYGPYDAQTLVHEHVEEAGIELVPFRHMVHVPSSGGYLPSDEVPKGTPTEDLSGTELRRLLRAGAEIPAWFSFPSVVAELRKAYKARRDQGFTVFFTGLSGSGKSTLAKALMAKLMELGTRPVTLLDGDIVRRNLSSELGFSREHRDLNIRRIGFVAGQITQNGGAAICAPIAPYDATRRDVRQSIEERGGFILVHVATPLEVCEARDRKGLYAKARAGIVKEFTGISDPYEEPVDADLVLDTTKMTPEAGAALIWDFLAAEGYFG